MRIQPITICKPKPNFTQKNRHKDTDRAVTLQDLYEMEDRINAKNKYLFEKQNRKINEIGDYINQSNNNLVKDQNKIIGNALVDITKLIYFRPLATAHDCYKAAEQSSKAVKNNEIM